jgi:hypothetical protein
MLDTAATSTPMPTPIHRCRRSACRQMKTAMAGASTRVVYLIHTLAAKTTMAIPNLPRRSR